MIESADGVRQTPQVIVAEVKSFEALNVSDRLRNGLQLVPS